MYIVIYKWYFLSVFVYYKDSLKDKSPQQISLFVIISAKNEANRLAGTLNSILTSDFLESSSKVIVIDDHSSEIQHEKMKSLCEQFSQVDFVVSKAQKGKKHAIRYAVSLFPSQYYAFTDADCKLEQGWYESICKAFSQGDFIMGYAPFKRKRGLLNELQRFEGLWIGSQYMAYAIKGMPYMAVGRNMAVTSSVLEETIPKMKADHLLSGDDDMLVQALQVDTTISLMLDSNSFAVSDAEETYSRYLSQRTRQISTSMHYKRKHQVLLGGISFAMMIFYGIIMASLFVMPLVAIGFYVVMAIINLLFFWVPTQKFAARDLRWKVLYLDLIYTINLYVLGVKTLFSKGGKWK